MMQRSDRTRRRGTILVYFALLLFALMALAAMAVDVGFVITTQRALRSAADTAALEGLRFRDDPSAANADLQRRRAASTIVTWLFDDDLNPANGDRIGFGAGPVVNYTGGVGQADALQSVTGHGVYKPTLQTNDAGNDAGGDLVAGVFTGSPDTRAVEDAAYQRLDFTVSAPTTAPTAPAFLARLRRTGVPAVADMGTGASVGPGVPLLFARGSLHNNASNPRQNGITVRATAIADGRPVVAVGRTVLADPTFHFAGSRGITPFSLQLAAWTDGTTFPDSQRVDASVNATTGAIQVNSTTVGTFHDRDPQGGLTALGQLLASAPPPNGLTLPPADSPAEQARLDLYVPLVDTSNRIVAFGHASMTSAAGVTSVQIRKHAGAIAPDNATASPVAIPNLDDRVLSLFSDAQHNRVQWDLLLAPVLVR